MSDVIKNLLCTLKNNGLPLDIQPVLNLPTFPYLMIKKNKPAKNKRQKFKMAAADTLASSFQEVHVNINELFNATQLCVGTYLILWDPGEIPTCFIVHTRNC